jgi:hypothetical protein
MEPGGIKRSAHTCFSAMAPAELPRPKAEQRDARRTRQQDSPAGLEEVSGTYPPRQL